MRQEELGLAARAALTLARRWPVVLRTSALPALAGAVAAVRRRRRIGKAGRSPSDKDSRRHHGDEDPLRLGHHDGWRVSAATPEHGIRSLPGERVLRRSIGVHPSTDALQPLLHVLVTLIPKQRRTSSKLDGPLDGGGLQCLCLIREIERAWLAVQRLRGTNPLSEWGRRKGEENPNFVSGLQPGTRGPTSP
jgi:hypothetical protein